MLGGGAAGAVNVSRRAVARVAPRVSRASALAEGMGASSTCAPVLRKLKEDVEAPAFCEA